MRKLITSVLGGSSLALLLAASALAGPSPLEPAVPASSNAHALADIYWVVFAIALALFVLVVVGLGLAVARGRAADARATTDPEAAPSRLGGARLAALVAVPVAALVVVAAFVLVKQGAARRPAATGSSIAVTALGTSGGWTYTYANGATSDDLRIPTGAVIRLTITAADVQHSWWVPSLAGQVRVFPGEPAQLSFRSDRDGTYAGRSTVAQGATATPEIAVVSLAQSDFDDWVGKAATAKGGS